MDGYNKPLGFMYTNWKGKRGFREVIPQRIYFGSTEWHKEEQWLMVAYDLDKKAERTFAMKDMENISQG